MPTVVIANVGLLKQPWYPTVQAIKCVLTVTVAYAYEDTFMILLEGPSLAFEKASANVI